MMMVKLSSMFSEPMADPSVRVTRVEKGMRQQAPSLAEGS